MLGNETSKIIGHRKIRGQLQRTYCCRPPERFCLHIQLRRLAYHHIAQRTPHLPLRPDIEGTPGSEGRVII